MRWQKLTMWIIICTQCFTKAKMCRSDRCQISASPVNGTKSKLLPWTYGSNCWKNRTHIIKRRKAIMRNDFTNDLDWNSTCNADLRTFVHFIIANCFFVKVLTWTLPPYKAPWRMKSAVGSQINFGNLQSTLGTSDLLWESLAPQIYFGNSNLLWGPPIYFGTSNLLLEPQIYFLKSIWCSKSRFEVPK